MKCSSHLVINQLNVKLTNEQVVDKHKYPRLLVLKNCFIRVSVVRYVQRYRAIAAGCWKEGKCSAKEYCRWRPLTHGRSICLRSYQCAVCLVSFLLDGEPAKLFCSFIPFRFDWPTGITHRSRRHLWHRSVQHDHDLLAWTYRVCWSKFSISVLQFVGVSLHNCSLENIEILTDYNVDVWFNNDL